MFRTLLLPLAVVVFLFHSGCTRARYRAAADRDSYWILREKDQVAAWDIPADYAVNPDPRARFYDPTCPDQPSLPIPAPRLNAYPLPPLASGLPPAPDENDPAPSKQPEAIPPPVPQAADAQPSPSDQLSLNRPNALPPPSEARAVESAPASSAPTPSNPLTTGMGSVPMRIVPIPTSAWEAIPDVCIDRMMEFNSLRIERARSFPNEAKRTTPNVQRLSLENLMELALINSREYQTRKEILYRTALAVTRQRYRYQLNPTPFGNGTAVNYRNLNVADRTVNTLNIPSQAAVQQTLASGGEFLARFANSVVLTFNGPQGFVADVGSELLFDFQQTVFQRDVRFELLTQSERDVVYAARDYIRFRKQLFRDISNQYYTLLLNYRNIEINSQDYFTNLRGFLQSRADYLEAERIPRIQVDQFEQNVLRTRSNLISNYFTLESSLDQLKFRLGLPPEMDLHLDLTELESLSARDEASVARQLIERSRAELTQSRSSPESDVATMVNYTIVLADRMANILRIQQRLLSTGALAGQAEGAETKPQNNEKTVEEATKALEEHVKLLGLLDARVQVDVLRMNLMVPLNSQPPAPPFYLFMRATDLCSALLQLSDLSIQNMLTPAEGMALRLRYNMLAQELEQLLGTVDKMTAEPDPDKPNEVPSVDAVPELLRKSLELVKQADALTKDSTGQYLPQEPQAFEMKVQLTVDKTLELCNRLLEHGVNGWEEMPVESNEAMLTALVQRLDLMNRRGDLADAWRQIKLAGDDLKSVMDLRATHILRTRSDNNSPFDFTFDDSETRLSMALDTPLNRRIQRNNYRVALIDYNVGLRNLIAAEDTIKLDVREDLRQLQLDRNQYNIAVASAALAYGRVLSTRARLALGTQNVSARDFLEAQQAYTNAVTTIARQHVNYIIDRTELFFDLEAFEVDDLGMWTGVRGESAPSMNTNFPETNPRPYDSLPKRPWYSPTIRQMERVPPGEVQVYDKEAKAP